MPSVHPRVTIRTRYFDSNFLRDSFVPTGDPPFDQPYDFSMGVNGTVSDGEPLVLQSAFSRKTHGEAGKFDLPLPLPLTGAEGIESRGGRSDSIYLTFNYNLTGVDSITSIAATPSVTLDPDDAKNLIVKVGGDCNAAHITIIANGVSTTGHLISATLTYGKLLGDVDGTGVVDSRDGQAIRAVAPRRG